MDSPDKLGQLQSRFAIEKYKGALALLPNIRRGDLIEKVAAEHMPRFGQDSPALMYEKLKNADDVYAITESSTRKFGLKSGVEGTGRGPTPFGNGVIETYIGSDGKIHIKQ